MTGPGPARRAVLAFLLVAASVARAEAAPKVSAHLEPDPIGMDELATFTIVVESSGFGTPDIDPDFKLDNFEVAAGPFRSSNQSWVNGVTSSSLQLIWRLRPLDVGPAAVRALRVKVEDELVQLPDALLQVQKAAPERATPPFGRRLPPQDPFASLFGADPFGRFDPRRRQSLPTTEPKLKMRMEAEPATVWVGQQLTWRLLLDTQTDVTRVEPRKMPDFGGFWVRDITPEETPEPRWIEVEGERFARVPVLQRALFALEPGSQTIPPVEVQVVAQIADVDYYRPIARPRAFDLSTGAVTVQVKPLPPAPAGVAAGATVVGRLQLAAKLDRARIDAGQAASLALTATSTGNLQALEPPALGLPDGLRAFAPTRESEEKLVGGRLETTVRWSYVLLADRAGSFPLAPIELAYFDPETASYRTARTAALELAVDASASAAQSTTPEPRSAPAPTSDPAAGGAGSVGLRRALLPTAAVVGLALVASAVWSRRRSSGRPAEELAAAIDAAESEPAARVAAAQLEEAWRRFLADRWSIARSLPPGQWAARVASQGVPEKAAGELVHLFEELHFLAYAPELAEVEAHRSEVVARSRRLLRRLR